MSETVANSEAGHPSETQPRGERGRFAERPRTVQQQVARLQAAFLHELTEDDVAVIARKLVAQARDGDNTSARLVLKYGLGELLAPEVIDFSFRCEAKDAAKAAGAAAPTAEQLMEAIRMKMQEQQHLEAEILGAGRPGGMPPPPAGRTAPPAAKR